MKSKTSTKPRNIFYTYLKRFKLVIIILVLVAAYALAHNIWIHNREVEDYRQKPLVSGVDFLKRNYTSGCLALDLIMCNLGPEMTYYYYETDLTAEELANSFPEWQLKEPIEHKYILLTNSSNEDVSLKYDTLKTQIDTYKRGVGIKSVSKKAIVSLSAEDYQKLTRH